MMSHPTDGDDTPRCKARTKKTGVQCKRRPVPGAAVCVMHGGAAPQVQAAAARRLAAKDAELAVVTYGLPRNVEPGIALLEEVHRTAGHVAWLGERVAEFDAAALSWGRTSVVDKGSGEFPGRDATSGAVPPVLLELYLRERKHLVDVCRAALASGIEERRVRLAESQGQLLAGAIRAVLDRLGLSEAQAALVPVVVPEVLRSVAVEVEA